MTNDPQKKNWHKHFDERQLNEIEFSAIYTRDFQHGTDGHNAKMIIGLMASILGGIENALMRDDTPGERLRAVEEIMRVKRDANKT